MEQDMEKQETVFNKNILIAVDESENASRAVSYVGQFLGGLDAFKVTVLHVIPKPEEDFFRDRDEEAQWLERYTEKIDALLEGYRQDLIRHGFKPDDVSVRSPLRSCPSMAECILDEREKEAYSTIVVGRQGLSRSEEFIFGSISSKIVTHAKHCTIWVVE
jgi:nucleotide-binding universal stress UspA family protein